MAWASVIWIEGEPFEVLEAAWLRVVRRGLGTVQAAWKAVEGPAGAVQAECMGLAWRWTAWHTIITEEDLVLDMRAVCPDDVRAMVVRRSDAQH